MSEQCVWKNKVEGERQTRAFHSRIANLPLIVYCLLPTDYGLLFTDSHLSLYLITPEVKR